MIGRVAALAAAGIVVIAAAACGGGSSVGSGGPTLEFTITDAGCNPFTASAAPGSTTFHVTNTGANNITEFEVLDSASRIVGEKENLTPGLEGSFTVDLKPGAYTLACPGGTEHATGTLTVGASASSARGSAADEHHDNEAAGGCVPTASAPPSATKLKATLSDFKIELSPTTIPAGPVELDATNHGMHPHEIVIVKGVASNALPTDANGMVEEDKLPAGSDIGEIEPFKPGLECRGGFTLEAGTYTLFCNVMGAEEGAHFRNGMVATLTVS